MLRFTSVAALFILLLLAMSVHAGQNFIAIAYHDVGNDVSAKNRPDGLSVSTQNLAAHFAWLHHHGYTPVSIDDLIAASSNEQSLPDKAVLLTFRATSPPAAYPRLSTGPSRHGISVLFSRQMCPGFFLFA